jgi:hypothetical protein
MRQEIRDFVDVVPELSFRNKPLVIETDLTDEEYSLIDEGMRDYDRDHSTFTDWEIVKKELAAVSHPYA